MLLYGESCKELAEDQLKVGSMHAERAEQSAQQHPPTREAQD